MNEQFGGLQEKFRGQLDRVIVVVFLLFMIGIIYAYLQEQSVSEEIPPTPPTSPFTEYLPNDKYERVIQVLNHKSQDLEKDEGFISLGRFNVFDYKTVRDHEIILKEMNQKFAQAQQLYNDDKYDEAREILKEILTVWPAHMNSQDLLKKINEQLNASSSPSS